MKKTSGKNDPSQELLRSTKLWTKELNDLAKNHWKEVKKAVKHGDVDKKVRLEAAYPKKIVDQAFGDFEQFVEVLKKIPTKDKAGLRKRQELIIRYRRACLNLEIDLENYIRHASLHKLQVDLWDARNNAIEEGEDVWEEVWKCCIKHILKKISAKPKKYPGIGETLMLLAQYEYQYKEIKKICNKHRGKEGRHPKVRRAAVIKCYPDLKDIYAKTPLDHRKDEPSYYARNLVANWAGISYRSLVRKERTAKKHIKYHLEKEGKDISIKLDDGLWKLITPHA